MISDGNTESLVEKFVLYLNHLSSVAAENLVNKLNISFLTSKESVINDLALTNSTDKNPGQTLTLMLPRVGTQS